MCATSYCRVYSRNNKLTSHLVITLYCTTIMRYPCKCIYWTNLNLRTDCDFYARVGGISSSCNLTIFRCPKHIAQLAILLFKRTYFARKTEYALLYKIPTNFRGQERGGHKTSRTSRSSLGIISIMYFPRERESRFRRIDTSENLPGSRRRQLTFAERMASPISRSRSRMSLRSPPPVSLSPRCTRKRSSRGPRSARSCCPPAAGRDPCVGSGIPACGRDRRASIAISL